MWVHGDGETGRERCRRKGGHPEVRDPGSGSRQHVQTRGPLAQPFRCKPEPDPGHTAVTEGGVQTPWTFPPALLRRQRTNLTSSYYENVNLLS